WTVFDARAQTCAQAPSCSQLGYTQTASECSGKAMLFCPFNSENVFCGVSKSCENLGYTMTTTQCTGRKYITCPYDATKVVCDMSAMIGEIRLWPTATAPKGWAICDGTYRNITAYKALYDVIGTTYGSGSGTFALPNFKGRVPVGVGYATQYTYTLAEKGGANFVELTSDQIPDHKHIMPWGEATNRTDYGYAHWGVSPNLGWDGYIGSNKTDYDNYWFLSSYMYGRIGYRSYPTSADSGWGTAGTCSNERTSTCTTTPHENRMPYLAVNYIIYTGVY
ncbi:MAG: hypothetical protein E7010_01455, partial [Alphaproteobacteria bacterium]|nr:hypothetical protein [Alphaproteobacteria bacterium]